MQTVSFGILRPQSSLTALSVMYLARAIPRRRSWIPARDVDRHRDVGRHPRGRQIPKSQIESQIESSTVVHLLVLLLRPSKLPARQFRLLHVNTVARSFRSGQDPCASERIHCDNVRGPIGSVVLPMRLLATQALGRLGFRTSTRSLLGRIRVRQFTVSITLASIPFLLARLGVRKKALVPFLRFLVFLARLVKVLPVLARNLPEVNLCADMCTCMRALGKCVRMHNPMMKQGRTH